MNIPREPGRVLPPACLEEIVQVISAPYKDDSIIIVQTNKDKIYAYYAMRGEWVEITKDAPWKQ